MASRHLSRSIVLQSLFEWDFYGKKGALKTIVERNIKDFGPGLEDLDFIYKLAEGVEAHMPEMDKIICMPRQLRVLLSLSTKKLREPAVFRRE